MQKNIKDIALGISGPVTGLMQKNIKDIALGISIGLVTGLMWLYTSIPPH
jgi:hypothetical protein